MNYASSFHRLGQMAGNPELTCIKPLAQWTSVPTGYTFDASYDAYLNSGGTVWKPVSTDDLNATDYETVPFLPGAGNADIALVAGGWLTRATGSGASYPATLQRRKPRSGWSLTALENGNNFFLFG